MKNKLFSVLTLGLFCIIALSFTGFAQEDTLKHSINFSPLSPLFKIYAIQFDYAITPKDELMAGFAYTNIHYDIGNTNCPTLIVGYRRYIWGNLHIEYQLWPGYDNFYEKNEKKYYKSFDVWNEFRLGYRYDFTVAKLPCYINLQWPFGFGLYAQNKPQSFRDREKNNRYFYFPPMFFLGVKF